MQSPDLDTAGSSVLTPESNTISESHKLTSMPASRVLGAEFVEQLGGVHVGSLFQSSTHQRPNQCERVLPLDVPSGKCLSLDVALHFDLWV